MKADFEPQVDTTADDPPAATEYPGVGEASEPAARSMTGQGTGRAAGEIGSVAVEIRSVNHRGLRINLRMGDRLTALEGRLEQLIRGELNRGSLQVNVSLVPAARSLAAPINSQLVLAYAQELHRLRESLMSDDPIDLAALLQLPGAIDTSDSGSADPETVWPLLRRAALAAIENLDQMRAVEGAAMVDAIRADCESIEQQRVRILEWAPAVVEQYRERLEARVSQFLQGRGIDFGPLDLLREVQIFADRCDISEELTRLASHLRMFAETLITGEAGGRKLDFIIQEMFRETNTIGSKSADARIAAAVVEIKCAIERMRELVQNIE